MTSGATGTKSRPVADLSSGGLGAGVGVDPVRSLGGGVLVHLAWPTWDPIDCFGSVRSPTMVQRIVHDE
jgi:hypothetical protein